MKFGMIVLGSEYPSISNTRTDFDAPAARGKIAPLQFAEASKLFRDVGHSARLLQTPDN